MKRITVILAGLVIAVAASAQMLPDSTVQIVASWQIGDKYSYSCERSSKQVNAQGDTVSREHSTEIMTFEVIGMTEESYQIKLSYDDAEYSNELNQTMHDLIKNLGHNEPVLFSTTRHGALMSIDNLDRLVEEYASCVGPLCELLVSKLSQEELEGFDLNGFTQQVATSLANPNSIQTTILDDIGRLFFFHGARLNPGDTYTMEEPLNFVWPGMEQQKAQTNLWAEKELTDAYSTVCRTYTSANIGETVKSAVSDRLDSIHDHMEVSDSLRNALGLAMEQTSMKAKWEQYTSEEIHLNTGWPLSFYQDKYVYIEVGDEIQEKIDEYYMEIILPDENE